MNIVGLDIGGANLKAADGRGAALQRPFPLWKNPDLLGREIVALLNPFGRPEILALTMTGELCDCFSSKAEGVATLIAAVERAMPRVPLRVWTTDGVFQTPHVVALDPLRAAAANWLALATFAGRLACNAASLVIDLGSTTCDIVPLQSGIPRPTGRSDPTRMAARELVYCGVRRTPVCAILGLDVAAEFFATTEDVYVMLGELPEDSTRIDTADGRSMTVENCRARLARMKCDESWSQDAAVAFARTVRAEQVGRIAEAVVAVSRRQPESIEHVVAAGAGEFLIPDVVRAAGLPEARIVSLSQTLGPAASVAACAHAVAVLAAEEL
jgi:probable H4MPT-linked C1 transfer pathway protein